MLPGRTWSLTTFLATVLLTARPAAACSDGRAHAAGIASRSECPIPTIVHGQIGVGGTAHFFMETQHLDPTFQGVWEGALEWIMADAQPGDPDWYEHLSSPGPIDTTGFMWEAAYGDFFDGYPGSRPTIWNAEVLARGYLMNGNVAYLPYARGGLQWLLTQNVADVIPWIPGGVGCLYMEWVCATGDIWAAGANAGIASTARYALEIFRSAPPNSVPEAEQIMDCSMEALHALATEDSASGGVYWPADATAPEGEIATGFCAGGSGILRLYLEMLLTFPEDPVIEDLALKSLKLFQHHAIQDSLGTSWPQTIGGTNFPPGVGLGTAGVGRAFLDAYQVFPDSTHYLDYARGAADWLVNVAEKPSPDVIKWLDGGNGYSSTWCRGATGIMYFLWDVGGATGGRRVPPAGAQGRELPVPVADAHHDREHRAPAGRRDSRDEHRLHLGNPGPRQPDLAALLADDRSGAAHERRGERGPLPRRAEDRRGDVSRSVLLALQRRHRSGSGGVPGSAIRPLPADRRLVRRAGVPEPLGRPLRVRGRRGGSRDGRPPFVRDLRRNRPSGGERIDGRASRHLGRPGRGAGDRPLRASTSCD